MTSDRDFLEGKEKALKLLQKAKSQNKVDDGILSILDIILSFIMMKALRKRCLI